MLADRQPVIAHRPMRKFGDVLEYRGATDDKQGRRRAGIDAARHLRDDAKLGRLQRQPVEFDPGDIANELDMGWIAFRNFRLHDLLETSEIARGTADAGHAGALI